MIAKKYNFNTYSKFKKKKKKKKKKKSTQTIVVNRVMNVMIKKSEFDSLTALIGERLAREWVSCAGHRIVF